MGSLGSIALTATRKGSGIIPTAKEEEELPNVIEFAESPWGLGGTELKLFPVQKVILKAHYGVPLDDNPKNKFKITDWTRTKERWVTEAEYLRFLNDEGRCNIREVVPGKELRDLCLSLGRRSGKCVREGTLIPTPRGMVPIESLGDPNGPEIQPLEVEVVQEGGKRSKSSHFYNGGVRDVVDIRSYCGYNLGGTPNHRIKVLSEDGNIVWKYLQDVRVGDILCVHRKTDMWAQEYVDLRPMSEGLRVPDFDFPQVLDEKLGSVFGYLLLAQVLCVGVSPPPFDYQSSLGDLNRLRRHFIDAVYAHEDKYTTKSLSAYRSALREFLCRCGITKNLSSVPHVIFKSPKPVVVGFLRALFESVGGLKLITFSKQFAHGIQLLLLNLGLVSKVKEERQRNPQLGFLPSFKLEVHGHSKGMFQSLFGFGPDPNSEDPCLNQCRWVQKFKDTSDMSNEDTLARTGWDRNPEGLNYGHVRRILEVGPTLGTDPEVLTHFQELVDADYFFDPIVSVTPGTGRVYDLSVPDGESFAGNGITNHNTFLASVIAAYETFKLLKKGDPQAYYGLPATNPIHIISVATDKEQAGLLYQEVSGHFRNVPFFFPYMANNTMSYAKFQTPKDIERYGSYSDNPNAKATIKITFKPCVAKGLRGMGNLVVILDEFAHFTDKGQSGAESVYNAVTPSRAAYSRKDPENKTVPIGDVESRVIMISSPLGKQGMFYSEFQRGLKGARGSEDMLCVLAPTWEVNPTVPASLLEKEFAKDPNVFFTEYGGEFTDRTLGWLENHQDLIVCVDANLRPQVRGASKTSYFMGIDLAMKHDGSAISIGHVEPRAGKVVVDIVDQMRIDQDRFKGKGKDRLDFDEIADWILDFSKRFLIKEGIFDMWNGIPFEQALLKRGLRQFKAKHFTKNDTSAMFQNFKDMMHDRRLVLYDHPIPDGQEHCSYIQELMELQAEFHSKYIITVEAPQVEGKYDDQSDALVRMVWLASQNLGKHNIILNAGGSSMFGGGLDVPIRGYGNSDRLRSLRSRFSSGSSPERMVPRGSRFQRRVGR